MAERRLVSHGEWEQPPEPREVYDWDKIADQLRKRPMEWAKVYEWDRTSVANAIRQGSIKAVRPADGFEIRTSNNTRQPVRMCTLFMRFNPGAVDGKRKRRK